ncbi:hypothetical protein MNAN1_001682 [Malassezia nana]|uniref:Transcription factor TFIIIC triple barrel domain-containing protein n=1 Tax=Malassezia nana TaxID=180528 RepID=A0AAF0EHP2_9BASI|nr:hypothetical protein MNAN1_001682 [Malassezia nana]
MTRPLDASWVRVDDTSAPPGTGWELEEEDSELIVLNMGPVERAPAEARDGSRPGSSITLTGLETDTPMMKLEDMVMRGEWDELLGSEIVLCRDPSTDGAQWQPLRTASGDEATGASSTSTRRIAFTPVRSQQDAMLDAPSDPAADDLPREFDEDMPLAWHPRASS